MRKKIIAALATLGLCAGAISFIPFANAETSDPCCTDMVSAIQQLETTVKQNFEELIKLVNKLVAAEFTFDEEINYNEARYTVSTGQWISSDVNEKTNSATTTTLTQSFDQAKTQTTSSANLVQNPGQKNFQPDPKNFSLSELLNKLSFEEANLKTQVEQAEKYISFISGQSNPVLPLEPGMVDKNNPAIEAYRVLLGNYTAAQSAGVSALNRLIAERTPNRDLGKLVGVTKSISPLELESMIATNPLNSAWMQKMVTANPADIQKETLFLLVGMQYQAFQTNRQLEQLNATLAVMQLQQLQNIDRNSLSDLRSKAGSSMRK